MKLLLKTAVTLALLFASTFLMIKLLGLLTVDDIRAGFESLKNLPDYFIGSLVILLLFADLFIAIPTMTVIMLSGFFLGFETAMLFSFIGLLLAAVVGYLISWIWGEKLLRKVCSDNQQINQMQSLFHKHGIFFLILCRALPILPEVSSCLAGVSRMPILKFMLGWGLGTIPYLFIVVYAGSISHVNNPMPAVLTAIMVSATLWLAWIWLLTIRLKTGTRR